MLISKSPADQFFTATLKSIEEGTFVRLIAGKCTTASGLRRTVGRLVTNRGVSMISFTYEFATRTETKNLEVAEALQYLQKVVGRDFMSCMCFSTNKDIVLEYSSSGKPTLRQQKPSSPVEAVKIEGHDRQKNYIVPPTAAFLRELGITGEAGNVLAQKWDKFRQINKFIEIIDSLVQPNPLRPLNFIDFGSGKNYLTFALYDFLSQKLEGRCSGKGIEIRSALVTQGNSIAEKLGFEGLSFVEGAVAGYQTDSEVDLVVALHACDTATDDAIAAGIAANVRVLVVAPCCHKYLRPRINLPPELDPLFHHGIMLENLSVALTDGLRALVLEAFGYRTKIFEFISSEHTAKNIMITGVKSTDAHRATGKAETREQIAQIKKRFGVTDFYLEKLLS